MEGVSLDPVAAAAEAAAAANQGVPSELGRDEFLRLLVAKLENQDPLKPADDTAFVAELATFSSLEQLIDVNANLQSLAQTQGQLINSQALNLVGREALVEGGSEIRIRGGEPDSIVYVLPRPAREATLSIYGPEGGLVRTIDLDRSANGRVTLEWDGTDGDPENPQQLADGTYTFTVNAVDYEGDSMSVAVFRALPIEGVIFLEDGIALISGDREIPYESILEIRAGRD